MSVMPLLVIASITVASIFLLAFLWAVKRGQYDDLGSPSIRVLFEEKLENSRTQELEKKAPNT
jgi:cbb3-type cytochrome oxidase maturation protein